MHAALERRRMERYNIYVPRASGSAFKSSIGDLIPLGSENAVKRKILCQRCIEKGLIDADCKDPDRKMRDLINKARIDYVILNVGKGYFRPTPKDYAELRKFNRQNKSKALSMLQWVSAGEKLESDIAAGRLKDAEER